MVLRHRKFNPKKVPVELNYLIKKYHLDMRQIKYRSILNIIGIVSAFDISFTSTFIFMFVKNIYLKIIVGLLMLIPLILITFNYIGYYYKKKGMIIDGNKKN